MTDVSFPPCETVMAAEPALPSSPFFSILPKTDDAVFDRAIRLAFYHEGIWSNDPDDAGGPTKFGISLMTAQRLGDLDGDGEPDMDLDHNGVIDINDIRLLAVDKAVEIYRKAYWENSPYTKMPDGIAVKMFDLSINMGQRQANIILQRAVRSAHGTKVTEDGIVGPETLQSVQQSYSPALLAAIRSEAACFYRILAQAKPKTRKYLTGWLNRAYH